MKGNLALILRPSLQHRLGDLEPFCGFVRLQWAEFWAVRLLTSNHGVLRPLNSTQFELTGVRIAVKGVPSRVRQLVVIIDDSTNIETLDKKVFVRRFAGDPLRLPNSGGTLDWDCSLRLGRLTRPL